MEPDHRSKAPARLADQARQRRISALLKAGVELDDPSSTHLGGEVVVEPGARLRSFTILEGRTVIRKGAVIG
ncbi:MAG: hypothetical protein V3S03_03510, partial [Vicinamibacteria bacterium]